MTLEVWAPLADRVELLLPGKRVQLAQREGGWYSSPVTPGADEDYAFSLDGGEARPDPRSPWQPNGVHAMSRWVDHSSFEWSDAQWHGRPLAGSVLYEIHTGTFTPEGTFDAIIGKLGHLSSLGITAIELMPVAEFPGGRGWGYDGVDLYAPHHAYGGPAGLKRLVDACHRAGIAVIMDVVYNHLGPAGNYLSEFGPYFTDKYATPWGQAVNLDGPDSGPVRDFFVGNTLMWMRDYHIDGVRLDAIHAIVDTSATHLVEEIAANVRELEANLGRSLWVIAESDLNDPRVVRSPAVGGYGADAQWSDDFHHALHALFTGERSGYYSDFGKVEHVAAALQRAFVYDGRYSDYRKRIHGRTTEGLSGSRFLGYLQNHDQVGNRATGERSSALLSLDALKVAAALVLTAPFIPMLFNGEEWGAITPFLYFTDHDDPDLGKAISEGRRREFAAFGWDPGEIPDPQDAATWAASRLQWNELEEQPHADLLEWHRTLIRLRAEIPELTDGRLDRTSLAYEESARWLTMTRGRITVACNFSDAARRIPLPGEDMPELLLASGKAPALASGAAELQACSVAIFRAA